MEIGSIHSPWFYNNNNIFFAIISLDSVFL